MPRGMKICEKCGRKTGPRKKVCECGHKFYFVPKGLKPQAGKQVNWKELTRGDEIKVIQGSGPYWPKDKTDEEGEDIPMGYFGRYKVSRIDATGIHAYPIKAPESGHCYIFMGKETISKTGMVMRPHKIRKLKRRET